MLSKEEQMRYERNNFSVIKNISDKINSYGVPAAIYWYNEQDDNHPDDTVYWFVFKDNRRWGCTDYVLQPVLKHIPKHALLGIKLTDKGYIHELTKKEKEEIKDYLINHVRSKEGQVDNLYNRIVRNYIKDNY